MHVQSNRNGRNPSRRAKAAPAFCLASLAVAAWLSGCGGDGGSSNHIIAPPVADAVGTEDVGVPDASGADLGARPDMARPDGPIVDAAPPPDARPVDAATDAAADAVPDAGPPPPLCSNGADDDADGQIDYPADPGCAAVDDNDETDPAMPACSDGADNDGDGAIDGDDPGCAGPADPNEGNVCAGALGFRDITGQRQVTGRTEGASLMDASCRSNTAPEAVFLVTVQPGTRALAVDTGGSEFDTVLSVRRACDADDSEVACNDDDAAHGVRTSAVRVDNPVGDYYIIVDGFRSESGNFTLNLHAEIPDDSLCPPEGAFETCALGANCVGGQCQRAACFDLRDNDRDGKADYPNDPGCDAPEDTSEDDPATPPVCANFQDDDFDGLVDFPDDPDCSSAADTSEDPPPECADHLDNDGDGLIDLEDPGCNNDPTWPFEDFNAAACRDQQDNDADGLVDYPNDPGCDSLEDVSEADPDTAPACANGVDDDGNGLTDFPADAAGCTSAADSTEAPPCDGLEPQDITGQADARGNTNDASNEFSATCNPLTGPEVVLQWVVAPDRPLRSMRLTTRGSRFDTLLSVRDTCDPTQGETLACADYGANDGSAETVIGPQGAGTVLWIFVDSNSGTPPGIFRLRMTVALDEGATCGDADLWTCADGLACRGGTCVLSACQDGADNDRDGLADWPLDPGCSSPSDDDEVDPAVLPACSNLQDDDGNGLTDYPQDPGCGGAGDDLEAPECGDGVDNNNDGGTDYDRDGDGFRDRNADAQCVCNTDPHEGADPVCSDGCDNDSDGLIDLADPGCNDDPNGGSEFNQPQCQDGIDNDLDGYVDYPNDPGCPTADAPLERDPMVPAGCADGIDNDGDGKIDHASHTPAGGTPDDGCQSAADLDERGPCDTPKPVLPDIGTIQGTTANNADEQQGGCGFSNGASDAAWVAHIPYPAHVTANTNGSGFDTLLYARSTCTPQVACPAEPPPPVANADAALPPVDAALPPADASIDAAAADAQAPDAALPPADAAPLAPDAAVGPICVPGSSELACDDDGGDGAQSLIAFDWEGGDVYLFVDGFGSSRGAYTLTVHAEYPAGGQCGPELVTLATCAAGTFCRDQGDGTSRCVQ